MRWWIEEQLKAALLTDLKNLVPEDYFKKKENQLNINSKLDNSGHLSKQLSWGYAAGKLGHSLYFNNEKIISPRQLAAAEVLMHFGHLVSARASQEACSKLKERAETMNVEDGNSGNVSMQLKEGHIPQFEINLNGGLTQYLRHLSKEEALPYISLLDEHGLINLGIKERTRDIIIRKVSENIITVIVSVASIVAGVAILIWLGLPQQ